MSWKTRHVDDAVAESKYIMFAMYNLALISGISSFLVLGGGVGISTAVVLQTFATTWGSIMTVGLVIGPKFIQFRTVGDKFIIGASTGQSRESRSATNEERRDTKTRVSVTSKSANQT